MADVLAPSEALAAALVVAAATVVVASTAVRARRAGPLAVLLAAAPVAWVLLDPEFRIFSHHGFLHASYVEAILARGLPPTDPLLADRPLGYAWLHHAVMASLVRATGVHVSTLFALTDVLLVGVCAALLVAAARRLYPESGAWVLAPLLALYGASPLTRGPLARLLRGTLGVDPEGRVIPIQKFASTNSNQLGIVCFAWALYALSRLADRGESRPKTAALHLFGATLLAAWVYPLAWPAIVGTAGLAGLGWAVRGGARAAVLPWAAVALGSLCAGPYLFGLRQGTEVASVVLDPTWGHVSSGSVQWLVVLAPPLLLLGWFWRMRPGGRLAEGGAIVLVSAAVTGCGLHLLLAAGMGSEYKFLALAALAVGFALGGALGPRVRRRPVVATLLLAGMFLPAGSFFVRAWSVPWGETDQVRAVGRHLESRDPDRHALHEWLRSETRADAVIVDGSLDVPVFAGRRLYVAHDPSGRAAAGWGVVPSVYLSTVVGHTAARVRARTATSSRLLRGEVSSDDLAVLTREIGAAPVYVVARSPRARGHLRAAPGFEEVFASGPLAVYSLAR